MALDPDAASRLHAVVMGDLRKNRAAVPLFLSAEATSVLGNSAIGIVLPWLVLTRTGDPSVTGMVAAAAAAPAVLSALVGGQLIDRVGQRRMSVIADLGSAASVTALALVDLWSGLTVAWFVVLGVLGAMFDVPGMTARETLLGRVARTGGCDLDRLVALRQVVFGLSFLAGPALAGLLLSLVDPIRVVWLTAGCSLAAGFFMLLIRLLPAEPDPVDAVQVGGFRTVRQSPELRAMTVLAFGGALVTAPLVSVLLPAHFAALREPGWFGYSMAGLALGSLVGAAVYGVGSVSRRSAYVVGIGLMTLGLLGCVSMQGIWPVALGLGLVGLGNGLLSPVLLVFFVEQVRESVRGRVLGLFNAVTMSAAPLALGGMALLLTVTSLHPAASVVFGVWLLVAVYSLSGPVLSTLAGARPTPGPVTEETIGADH